MWDPRSQFLSAKMTLLKIYVNVVMPPWLHSDGVRRHTQFQDGVHTCVWRHFTAEDVHVYQHVHFADFLAFCGLPLHVSSSSGGPSHLDWFTYQWFTSGGRSKNSVSSSAL